MQINSLELRNFRGFETLEIKFHQRLTVLVGTNGSGKSTILDAVAGAIGGFRSKNGFASPGLRLPLPMDIANGKPGLKTRITLQHRVNSGEFDSYVYKGSKSREIYKGFSGWETSSNTTVVYQQPLRLPAKVLFSAQTNPESPLTTFSDWFRDEESYENEIRIRTQNLKHKSPTLETVRAGLRSLLGVETIEFRRRDGRLIFQDRQNEVSLQQLSDGQKSLVILVGDVARQMADALPDGEESLSAQVPILIDEVEIHLHPAWQREVLPKLLKIFPNCQFIVTTHSPQVLSTVPRSSFVYVLKDFKATKISSDEGRDSNSILNATFDVPERPQFMLDQLNELAALIDGDQIELAKTKISDLEKVLTGLDPELIRYKSLLDFIERGNAPDPEAH